MTKKTMTKTKVLPNSEESEKMVLGCMLNDANYLAISANSLSKDDFYFNQHKIIFSTLKDFHELGKPVDTHLIVEELKKHGKLYEIGGIDYLIYLSQNAALSANIEEYIKIVKDKSNFRKLLLLGQDITKAALDEISDLSVEKFQEKLEEISTQTARALPIVSMEQQLINLEKKLKEFRGKQYLGLCQKTIPEIDSKLLGLRKLILLAAAPNVGKTALTNQFLSNVLQHHPEACGVYFSLEMSAEDLVIRNLCNQSQLDYKTFVLGSDPSNGNVVQDAFFTPNEMDSIVKAEKFLKDLNYRLQIIDNRMCPHITASQAICHIESVKQKTGCKRAIVVIDYLGAWPTPEGKKSDIEADKWRIGEMKKIEAALNKFNQDPLIVISEARKPQGEGKWAGDMSDVIGSTRGTYTPDGVMLFTHVNSDEICKMWAKKNNLQKTNTKSSLDNEKIDEYFKSQGIAINRLEMAKGRDGMEKFSVFLEYHYRKNIFKPISIDGIISLINKVYYINNNSETKF